MEDEELTKSLLVAQRPGNIRIISNGVGSNDTGASASGVTVVLLLSAFVTACSAFTGGFVVSTIELVNSLWSCGESIWHPQQVVGQYAWDVCISFWEFFHSKLYLILHLTSINYWNVWLTF